MPKRITESQRQSVLEMLAQGHDRDTIAARAGVTPGQVSAISAHVTMGTYELPSDERAANTDPTTSRTANLLGQLRDVGPTLRRASRMHPVLLGTDAESNEEVFWNPDPENGSANPHVLVLGESGFGKTYTVSCLLAELAQQKIPAIVFDYGQGFSLEAAPDEFVEWARPVEIQASRDGIDINPLQIFPSDLHGPVNVAQRVADTFGRVYSQIGVQQHSVLRQAVLEVMTDEGIVADSADSWMAELPAFGNLQNKLTSYANSPVNAQRRYAASAASHISTLFVFNTFRSNGRKLAWLEMLNSRGRVFVIQLKGLEHSLERAVTEFLLWNLIGFVESLGPGPLRCFIVLDEAHKLSFDRGSPVEKLLREGRKFGLGLILASQQPDDFSPVAFANTATKIVFQVGDEKSNVSRQLHRKIRNAHSFSEIFDLITKLPRGWAYVVSENVGRVVRIQSLEERVNRWKAKNY
ncbi:MAG: ATP-binding protein [Planctomycetes bacterium]|nr:ATP-binding protein [Planctomycetota bacterium]